jgi:phosphatidylglycerophosphate synthase
VSGTEVGRQVLLSLWSRSATVALLLLAATYAGYAVVGQLVPGPAAARWFALAGSLVVVETAVLYASLPKNRRTGTGSGTDDASPDRGREGRADRAGRSTHDSGSGRDRDPDPEPGDGDGGPAQSVLLSGLGGANVVTLARGALFAWAAGFLVVPLIGVVAWLPGLVYGLGALLDAVDGAVARATGRVTALGSALDAEFDGLGLLAAASVGVAAGQLPAAYLVAGGARYGWLVAVTVRRRRGLPIHDLPERPSRRVLAGLQMAFCFVALLPATPTALGAVGAVALGGPFVLGFVRDWLYVSGRLAA